MLERAASLQECLACQSRKLYDVHDMKDRFENWNPPEIENNKLTEWNWTCQHVNNLLLGKNVDIGAFTYLNAKHGILIEDYVQIGSHCAIYTISTIDGKSGTVTLERNSRIGSHTVIMPGITVGENSIIGAFSFVNRAVPKNVLAHGVPIKIVRPLKHDEIEAHAIEQL